MRVRVRVRFRLARTRTRTRPLTLTVYTVEEFDLIRVLGEDVGNANKLLVLSSEEGVEALRDALEVALTLP